MTHTNDNNSSDQGGVRGRTNYQISTTALGKGRTPPLLPSSSKIAIKIEDDDNSKRLKTEEEVELWNDEDGLVVDEDFDALDSHLPPANKRQRTASPPPSTTTTIPVSHGTADPARKVQLINNAQHLIGSEVKQSPSIIDAVCISSHISRINLTSNFFSSFPLDKRITYRLRSRRSSNFPPWGRARPLDLTPPICSAHRHHSTARTQGASTAGCRSYL